MSAPARRAIVQAWWGKNDVMCVCVICLKFEYVFVWIRNNGAICIEQRTEERNVYVLFSQIDRVHYFGMGTVGAKIVGNQLLLRLVNEHVLFDDPGLFLGIRRKVLGNRLSCILSVWERRWASVKMIEWIISWLLYVTYWNRTIVSPYFLDRAAFWRLAGWVARIIVSGENETMWWV